MAKSKPKPAGKQDPPPTFERAVEQIESIVTGIESGEVTLEKSIEQYEQGMKLIKHCRTILDTAETRIKALTVDEDGNPVETDFTDGGG